MSTLAEPVQLEKTRPQGVVPPVPESIEETGIPPSIVEHLILKYLYFRGELVGRDIASLVGLYLQPDRRNCWRPSSASTSSA